jgi:hypothetical protein
MAMMDSMMLFRLASAEKLLTRPARGAQALRCMGQRPAPIPFKLLAATQLRAATQLAGIAGSCAG